MKEAQIPYYDATKPVRFEIVSTFSLKHGAAIGESLGSEAVAGHLQGVHGSGVNVLHTDFQLDPDIDALTARIASYPPHIFGVSVKIGALDQTREIMERIAQIDFEHGKRPLVVMGGVIPTFATTTLHERYPHSIMAINEGEGAAAALVDVVRGNKRMDQVPGIWYRDSEGKLYVNPPQRLDLKNRHLPARQTTGRIQSELHGMVWAEGSRGCDYNCTFCSVHDLHGGGFVGDIPPESVVADMQNLRRLGVTSVSFTDDDFGGDPERSARIAQLMMDAKLNMPFSISTRADHIWDEGVLKRNGQMNQTQLASHNARLLEIMTNLRNAGLNRVFLGMESGSPTQLRRYGKLVSVQGNYKAIKILQSLGIDAVAGYIPIDPLMNMKELQENIAFLRSTGMYIKVTNPLSVLRVQAGSPYLRMAQQQGVVGEQTEDLVFYNAHFKDPAVQKVATIADQWVQDIYPFIFGLKGEVATATLKSGRDDAAHSHAVKQALFSFRELEMNFIGALSDALQGGPDVETRGIVAKFEAQRRELIHACKAQAEAGNFGDSPRLLEVINQFCNH